MNANQMTVNVPDEMQSDVASWEDGKSYQVTLKQTGAGTFDLVSVDNTDTEANEQPPETEDSGAPANANPAIAAMMNK